MDMRDASIEWMLRGGDASRHSKYLADTTGLLLIADNMCVAQEFCRKPSGMAEWQPLPQDGATGGRAGQPHWLARREAFAPCSVSH